MCWGGKLKTLEAMNLGRPTKRSPSEEAALRSLQVWVGSGRRLYGGFGVCPVLGGLARGRTAGKLAVAGCTRMAGAGAFPSPIAHADRLPEDAALDVSVVECVRRCVYEAASARVAGDCRPMPAVRAKHVQCFLRRQRAVVHRERQRCRYDRRKRCARMRWDSMEIGEAVGDYGL